MDASNIQVVYGGVQLAAYLLGRRRALLMELYAVMAVARLVYILQA